MSKQELLDSVKLSLLQAGGVDNWTWYNASIDQFEEDNYEIEDDSDLLCALENGGVDNWEWYSESIGHYHEWEDHVNEFYDTDDYLDYEDFGIELERRVKEEDAERLAKKKAEDDAKPKSETSQLKYSHSILAEKISEFTGGERVDYFYKKVVESEGFWSGLGTDEGRLIFNEAKQKAQKHIKDNNIPFTSENFFSVAQEVYIKKMIDTDTFINHVVGIIFEG